jgi:hypothetical protein
MFNRVTLLCLEPHIRMNLGELQNNLAILKFEHNHKKYSAFLKI